jgi:hypothetical protein
MNRRQLLFVTYHDENIDEGIPYAIELAKAMSEDIVLLLVNKKDRLTTKIEDLMAGVAFAEAGEHETAQELVSPAPVDHRGKISDLVVKASKEGVHLAVHRVDQDAIAGIRAYVKEHAGIDKVVLSPSITESEALTTRDLNRLVRTASRPIVTMTRQSVRALKDIASRVPRNSYLIEKEYA